MNNSFFNLLVYQYESIMLITTTLGLRAQIFYIYYSLQQFVLFSEDGFEMNVDYQYC